jgi:Spy/CpxP family protein refolding chaperone
MKNWKGIAGVMLVFILGSICGGVVMHMVNSSRMEAFVDGGPGAREELLVKRLTRQLDLDSRQLEQIRPIVHETHASIRQIRQQSRPQAEGILNESQRRISEILRPEQREKFDKIIADRKAHRPRWGGN